MRSIMDIGSEDIDRQLNKVKIFQFFSVHIHSYKIRILGGTERISGHHSHNTFRRSQLLTYFHLYNESRDYLVGPIVGGLK